MSHREHGTYVKYKIDGCRCPECRAANSTYVRELNRRVAPPYVSAGPARAHVRDLAEVGVGLKRIAAVSGVSHGAMSKLMYGDRARGRGPSKRIRRSTEEKILAVTPADAAPSANVPAAATWRLVDDLLAAGVPRARIAEQIGQKGPGLQLGRDTVEARNARAVAALHAAWSAGKVDLVRRDCHGNTYRAVPPPAERGGADISDLLLELAEVVEARNDRTWAAQAACRDRPRHLWFPARGDHETAAAGVKICQACLVRVQCRADNMDQPTGTYGGLTAGARRRLRSLEVTAA